MNSLTITLVVISLAVLVLGAWLYRLTGSRKVMINVFAGSTMLLFAAYQATAQRQPEMTTILPFFATMLFAGRAMGWWWRTRKEEELRQPAQVLTALAALSLIGTLATCVPR
jgi:peptidoglycan/LPS O-acetylase OafA/YrhL